MNTSLKAIGFALTTVLFSTQAQAVQTSNASISYVLASNKPCERRSGISAAFSEFAKKLRDRLKMLAQERSAIDDILSDLDLHLVNFQGHPMPERAVLLAKQSLPLVHETIMISHGSFDKIMSDINPDQVQDALALRKETIEELNKVVTSFNHIIELDEKMKSLVADNQEIEPAVIYDIARMDKALKADMIVAPRGMSREEKRKFILSHAS